MLEIRSEVRRCLAGLLLGCALLGPPHAAAQGQIEGPHFLFRHNATLLLQGSTIDGFLSEASIDSVELALLRLHARHSEIRGHHFTMQGAPRTLSVRLSAEGRAQLDQCPGARALRTGTAVRVRSICLPGLDSLNALYGASRIHAWSERALTILFDAALDLRAVARHYAALPAVESASPGNNLFGPGGYGFLLRKPGRWHFVFVRAWGDCPSGCAYRHYRYYTYSLADGRTHAEGELLPDSIRRDRIYRWGIPREGLLQPFEEYADLERALADSAWWVRRHAIDALRWVLTRSTVEPMWSHMAHATDHFSQLRQAVEARRKEVLLLIVERLADEDEEVRQAAKHALEAITGQTLGSPEAWRQWLAR